MNFVFLRPFETVMGKYEMRNFMVAADVDFHDYDNLIYNWGNVLADRLFHVEAGHIFLEAAMAVFNSTLLNGECTYSGPLVLTKSFEVICGQRNESKRPFNPINYGRVKCSGMTIVDPKYFYPVNFRNARILNEKHLHSYWYGLFKNSVAVYHPERTRSFYGASADGGKETVKYFNQKCLSREIYGKKIMQYRLLGQKNAPCHTLVFEGLGWFQNKYFTIRLHK